MMKKKNILFAILFVIFPVILFAQKSNQKQGITIVFHLLRDRAVVLDSLVMKKRMFFSFKSSLSLSQVKGGFAAGTLKHQGETMAVDTTYFFDETSGNLGFSLPYDIPNGKYHLDIEIINSKGKTLDTYSGDYDRSEFKPYFNRSIQFWDFTKPYAHLDCRGYGSVTYHFNSHKSLTDIQNFGISARMTSGNGQPGVVEVQLNGSSIGEFNLPRGNSPKAVVDWQVKSKDILKDMAIQKGINSLGFVLKENDIHQGKGLRIFWTKNSTEPDIDEAVPLTLNVKSGKSSKQTTFDIPIWGEEGEHITAKLTIPAPENFIQQFPTEQQQPFPLNKADIETGYVIFKKDFQRYVYPWTIPKEEEQLKSFNITMGQNDFEPLTFSLYPIRDLGNVSVSVSNLEGANGEIISSENIQIHIAKILKKRSGSNGGYIFIPRLLDRVDNTHIPALQSTRFWLTIHADSKVISGKYSGAVHIGSDNEKTSLVPLTIEVLPIKLEPVPGVEYSMCMSYEFFELESKEWTAQEKEKIYQDGVNIFRDYKNHGMNTVDVTTPYYFQWNKDGSPRMEHFKAMVKGAKEVGFTDPIYWYFGHYVQATKGQHPGNVRTYDPEIHPKRAKFLVETALKMNQELNGPPLRFMPIDEPRIASRKKIALELFKEVKKVPGAIIMCTTNIGGEMLDIENSSQHDRELLPPGVKERKSDRKIWEYNNTAIQSLNSAYSRYIYGYYTWRHDLDGMNSWGPGTTENSRGNPFEELDSDYSDYFIFYPHEGSHLPTPNWEALREGIDDIRYIFQLEKLCKEKAGSHPEKVAQAQKYLNDVRAMCDFDDRKIVNDFGDWTPERFQLVREQVVSFIIKLKSL